MPRLLVLGYGNVDRRDDGVALVVVNVLRERLGQPPIDPHETDGLEARGRDLDTGFVQQLTPELAQVAAEYDHVVFVDAHIARVPSLDNKRDADIARAPSLDDERSAGIDPHPDLIRQVPVAAQARPTIVSHQLSPGTVLAVARELYGGHPTGTLLSIRGYDFDFGTGLSSDTAAGVAPAVGRIWAMYQAVS